MPFAMEMKFWWAFLKLTTLFICVSSLNLPEIGARARAVSVAAYPQSETPTPTPLTIPVSSPIPHTTIDVEEEDEATGLPKCSHGEALCGGNTCFNPIVSICFASGMVCPIGQLVCGSLCHNPTEKACLDGKLSPCPLGHHLCGSSATCFNPITATCFGDAGIVCPNGQQVCGSLCYSLSEQTCLRARLCPVGDQLCGDECYNPDVKTCRNRRLQPCSSGLHLCGNNTCYDPVESTCYQGTLCPNGQSPCGKACYNPLLQSCIGGKVSPCPRGQMVCGNGTTCYDPSVKTCFGDRLCNAGHLPCGNGCVDPKVQTCLDIYGRYGEKCPLGKLPCGREDCYDPRLRTCFFGNRTCLNGELPCGDGCHDPKVKACLDIYGRYGEKCPLGKLPCGRKDCYDPRLRTCFFGNQTCFNGELPCGDGCHNPKVQTCLDIYGRYGYRCPAGKLLCGQSHCYDPRLETCFFGNRTCLNGELPCGEACINPKVKACFDTYGEWPGVNCPVRMLPCGPKDCYDPTLKTCFFGNRTCLNGELPCGEGCINPKVRACVDTYGEHPHGWNCPVGMLPCGPKDCYDPRLKTCFFGNRTCLNGELPCNSYCFNPSTQVCFPDGRCKTGELSCGDKCYDPAFKTCYGTVLCNVGDRFCGGNCYAANAFNNRCLNGNWVKQF
ncbi:hypothetical protein BV898_18572 [Hypsibius exemplaris]|uniref:Tenascin-X n=1 Tax=Hypsibius exemplaris TaxID=2072580 RepID=A0A9X6RNZ4_HYPEX|nr:hypothetical protein BV898_18572 [Hypsibius exemplaris]